MKNLFKTTVAAVALFATASAFAVNTNVDIVQTRNIDIQDTAVIETSFYQDHYVGNFVQVSFSETSDSGITVTPVAGSSFKTNGGNVFFTNNFTKADSVFTLQPNADTITVSDSFIVRAECGVALNVPQYAEFSVSAKETFGKFGTEEFTAKPKAWGEISQTINGKTKIKKLAAAVIAPKKINKNLTTDSVTVAINGTTVVYDKKAVNTLYKDGISLVTVSADTGIVADSFIFDQEAINQAPVTVTLKASAAIAKDASKEDKKAAKAGLEVVQYALVAPLAMTDSFAVVYVDSSATVVDTVGGVDTFALPVITIGETFKLQVNGLGVKTTVKPTKTVYSTKIKGWVENAVVTTKKTTVKKVAVKFDAKSLEVSPYGVGLVTIEGVIKKLPKNFVPSVAGDVTTLVIETPTGVSAVPVVILPAAL